MVVDNIMIKGNLLLINNRIKITSQEKNKIVFEVLDEFCNDSKHDVRIITKKGCTLVTCDCSNCSRTGNAGICYNKWGCLKFFEMRVYKMR